MSSPDQPDPPPPPPSPPEPPPEPEPPPPSAPVPPPTRQRRERRGRRSAADSVKAGVARHCRRPRVNASVTDLGVFLSAKKFFRLLFSLLQFYLCRVERIDLLRPTAEVAGTLSDAIFHEEGTRAVVCINTLIRGPHVAVLIMDGPELLESGHFTQDKPGIGLVSRPLESNDRASLQARVRPGDLFWIIPLARPEALAIAAEMSKQINAQTRKEFSWLRFACAAWLEETIGADKIGRARLPVAAALEGSTRRYLVDLDGRTFRYDGSARAPR